MTYSLKRPRSYCQIEKGRPSSGCQVCCYLARASLLAIQDLFLRISEKGHGRFLDPLLYFWAFGRPTNFLSPEKRENMKSKVKATGKAEKGIMMTFAEASESPLTRQRKAAEGQRERRKISLARRKSTSHLLENSLAPLSLAR